MRAGRGKTFRRALQVRTKAEPRSYMATPLLHIVQRRSQARTRRQETVFAKEKLSLIRRRIFAVHEMLGLVASSSSRVHSARDALRIRDRPPIRRGRSRK